ncbi:Ubiquitin family protein [Trichomonas vaginalis G3]|uniref:Ubiquitin family protein n=1 Tax=Trichomonas vaginalis (strain ATCC PRA-98 / G3) TaxID=412133 RepID=A2DRY2_TRIV3|nr:ubiquitin-like family [Trichomonas vaginalis G3]EAY16752.1 Ubiquitin family protein [Trichomonas vaginalis G3]KAI5490841.1 ubiquitin-like family [Trichomonas vaginalis G3]|eukprot:XP_001328975.1 Ubiquitin family protein [Trichomonas vaginalis G3]
MCGQFTIRYILVNGETSDIRVRDDETIRELMEELEEKTGYPVENQMLLFNGQVLAPDSTIESSKVQPGDSIHITPNLVGG